MRWHTAGVTSRREFLTRSLGLVGLLACDPLARRLLADEPAGELLGVLPFLGEGDEAIGRKQGRGLASRLAFDLGKLRGHGAVDNDRLFIRTEAPRGLAERLAGWTVAVRGDVAREQRLTIAALRERATDRGVHLIECSGNARSSGFGMIGAARWSGVGLRELLDDVYAAARPAAGATRIEIGGYDEHRQRDRISWPGCSWIFTRAQLADAFLATGMNGAPLPADHGAPLRLIVPGWYGCCQVKWVDRIVFWREGIAASDHMREFAERTHQTGDARVAREYAPARIDTAAMPVRVERWAHEGRVRCRIIGIVWGGTRPVDRLRIRIGSLPPRPIALREPSAPASWRLWVHDWPDPPPGRHAIRLEVPIEGVRTRRLDSGYYTRTIQVPRA